MKRKKFKSNRALTLILCGAVLLFSIGLALARGSGETAPYKTTDLALTQGDNDYDLTSGINYDAGKYTLSVTDEGGFDINTPGTYIVGYALTPVTKSAVNVSPSQTGESSAAPKPEDSSHPAAPKPEDSEKPGDGKPSKPAPDAKPDPSQSSAPKPDAKPAPSQSSVPKPDAKPDPSQSSAPKPDAKPAPSQSSAPKPDAKPAPSQSSVPKPDAKPDSSQSPAPKPDAKPAPSQSPAPKPDAKPDPSQSSAPKPDAKPDPSQSSAPKPDAKPAPAPASTSASAKDSDSKSDTADLAKLPAFHGQGALSMSQNLLPAAQGYGAAFASPNPLTVGAAPKSDGFKPDDSKTRAVKIGNNSLSSPSESGAENKSDQQGTTKPTAGGPSGTPETTKPSHPDKSSVTKPSHPDKSSVTKPSSDQPDKTEGTPDHPDKPEGTKPSPDQPDKPDATKPSPDQPDKPDAIKPSSDQPDKPDVTKPSSVHPDKPESTKPSPDQTDKPESTKPSPDQSDKPDASKPSPEDESANSERPDTPAQKPSVPSAPETLSQPGIQAGGSLDGAAGSQLEKLEVISFTRNVVVKPAVEYQDIRLDVSSGKQDEKADQAALLSGMKFDDQKYGVQVTDDGHFLADRIGEYKVSYELTGVSDGRHIADLERYVWVTAPGAKFTAPPLTIDPSQKYDLFSGIVYDSQRYDLSLVDPNAFDPANGGTQRVMYRLTLRSDSDPTTNDSTINDSTANDSSTDDLTANDSTDHDSTTNDLTANDPSDGKPEAAAGTQNQSTAADGSADSQERKGALTAAVFGREVTVSGGYFIQFDAPPLIVTQGATQAVNLLEDVKATDEKGQPVKPEVVDRSQLDDSVKKVQTVQSDEKEPAPESTAAEPSAATLSAMNRSVSPFMSSFLVMPPAVSPSEETATPSAVSPSEETATPSAVSPSEETAAPPAVSPSEETATPPAVHLPESASLPADLAPGTYLVTLAAVHPVTGKTFTTMRKVEVRAYGETVLLYKKTGTGVTLISSNFSMAAAFQTIGNSKNTAANYIIVVSDPYPGYQFSVGDQRELGNLTGLNTNITITITGVDPKNPNQQSHALNLSGVKGITLPYSADASLTGSFIFKDLQFSFGGSGTQYIVASGSKLTMADGLLSPATSNDVLNVIGGCMAPSYTGETKTVKTDITVQSGNYYRISGGNYNMNTDGDTRVTMEGSSIANRLTGGSDGDNLNVKYNQTGNSSVTVTGTGKGTTVTQNSGVYALFAGTDGNQTGACTLAISGGTLNIVRGGAAYSQTEASLITVTGGTINALQGGAAMSMGAADTTVTVDGEMANIGSLWGSSASEQSGDITINMENGTVNNLYGASNANIDSNLNINVNGGTLTGDLYGRSASIFQKRGNTSLNLNSSQTINQVCYFDKLNLKAGVKLIIKDYLRGTSGVVSLNGVVSFGAGSVMSLDNSSQNSAVSLATAGPGATLELKRQADQSKAPLNIETWGGVNMKANPLTLKFTDATAADAISGDQFIKFVNNPGGAVSDGSYAAPSGGYPRDLFLWGQKGSIILEHAVGLQTGTPDALGPLTFYGNVAAAMNQIGSNTGDYTVSIRKENYQLTADDARAITTQGKQASSITFTSGFTIQDSDPLEKGESVGKSVRRTVIVGTAAAGAPKPDLGFGTDTVVENMKLQYMQAGGSLFANGHSLTVGDNVEINSEQDYFPTLYGGADGKSVANANLSLSSGKFSGIYGGGKGPGAQVTGNVNIMVDGMGQLSGDLYGGGENGPVLGTVTIQIQGGKLLSPASGRNRVIGGGSGTGGTVGSCKMTISGGTATGPVDVAGCDQAAVTGDVSIRISKFGPEDQTIVLPAANVYGGGMAGGTVGGSATIQIADGKDYNVISGGGNPAYAGWPAGMTAGTSVTKEKNITLLGDVEAVDAVNFTNLNLGAPITASKPNKASVKIDGTLDSNPEKGLDYSLRTGTLNFYGGSVLNLAGQTSPAVGNFSTENSSAPSHLHISKQASGSLPLHVAGKNLSAEGSKLVLGILSGTTDVGATGDQLLVFEDAKNINLSYYLSDSHSLELVSSGPVVAYGAQSYPEIDGVTVRPRDVYEKGSGKTNPKDLTFALRSQMEDNVTPGSPIQSAYVDNRSSYDQNWAETGADPVLPPAFTWKWVDLTDNGNATWTGRAAVDASETTPYFIHVRTEDSKIRTMILDLESPENVSSCQVGQDGENNYTVTVTLHDPVLPVLAPNKGTYTASGLYQTGWCLGDASGPPSGATAAALSYPMDSKIIHEVTDVPQEDIWTNKEVTFHIQFSELGDPTDLKSKVIYLFIKDKAGNTTQLAVSMSKSLISVSLPLRTGVVALTGGDSPQVEAPVCCVENGSQAPVKAEIMGATVLKPSGGAPALTFTSKTNGFTSDEMNLQITSVPGSGLSFLSQSVADFDPSISDPLELGTMQAAGSPGNTVNFTFAAMFDQNNIIHTNGWSICQLSYRFTLLPVSGSDPATGKNALPPPASAASTGRAALPPPSVAAAAN